MLGLANTLYTLAYERAKSNTVPMMEILVIGGANIDIKANCVSCHVAATSNPALISYKLGGVARNIAHNLARLGDKVSLLSVVGADQAGQGLLRTTAEAGVDISLCQSAKGTTGTYIAFLDEAGELITAANDMAVLKALTPVVIAKHANAIKSAKFVIADCNLSLETLKAVAVLAAEKLIIEPVSVSKSKKLKTLAAEYPIFLATPNLDQIEALTQSRDPKIASAALHKMGIKNLVIHSGSLGAYASDQKTLSHMPAQAKKIIDVTGAGDAATAGLVHALLQGVPLAKATAFGQKTAALVIASNSSTLE